MHELAVCQSLLDQARRIADQHGADEIEEITVSIGALSGVEVPLLRQAFTVARAAAGFPQAELSIEQSSPKVHCPSCGADSTVAVNRLICSACGNWRVRVTAGNEMILKNLVLTGVPEPA